MNKKRIILIFAMIIILVGAAVGVLLWRAADDQPAPKNPVSAVEDSIFDDEDQVVADDVKTPSVGEQSQEADQEDTAPSDEPLKGNSDVEPALPEAPLPAPGELSYEDYNAMSTVSQRAYMESFENIDDYFDWYYEAKEAYDEAHPDIDVGDGVIDLEDLLQGE